MSSNCFNFKNLVAFKRFSHETQPYTLMFCAENEKRAYLLQFSVNIPSEDLHRFPSDKFCFAGSAVKIFLL